MKKFIIERALPGIGGARPAELREAAQKSNAVLDELGTDIQWVHSYISADRTFCIYLARDEALVHRHAERSGFPATRVYEVSGMFDPTTAGSCAVQAR